MTTAQPQANPEALTQAPERLGDLGFVLFGLFGVLLPVGTLTYELWSGSCADVLFDPIPTFWHVLLVALVPVANGLALAQLRYHSPVSHRHVMLLLSFAIGVELYYALIFLPITPVSVMLILVFGLGLLPLSPLISLLVSLYLHRRVRRISGVSSRPPLWLAMVLVPVSMALAGARDTLTLVSMHTAASADSAQQARGLAWLRGLASEDSLMRACLADAPGGNYLGAAGDLVNPLAFAYRVATDPLTSRQYRAIYYRVTGMSCAAIPEATRARLRRGFYRDARWGPEPAPSDDRVGPLLPGLHLQQSQMYSRIRPQTATSYTEWTLWLRNDSVRPREARTMILLPAGGVVSRLTLRVKGEEQEAAYAQRKKVEKAYQKVVAKRRDPVLVTTRGSDSVFMQAFPVPPGGGTMKVRIGITAPLAVGPETRAVLRLPSLQQSNFDVPANVRHALRIDARGPLRPLTGITGIENGPTAKGGYRLSGQLSDESVKHGWSVDIAADPRVSTVWVGDPRGPAGTVIEQRLVAEGLSPPDHIVLLIDGSRAMAAVADDIADALAELPRGAQLSILVAGDSVSVAMKKRGIDEQAIKEATDIIHAIDFVGGADNRPALSQALELANSEAGTTVLWLHAQQPVELDLEEQGLQGLAGTGIGPSIGTGSRVPTVLTLALLPGRNRLADAIDGLPGVTRVNPPGAASAEIRAQFARWRGERPVFRFDRQRVASNTAGADLLQDDDVARLWALQQVKRSAASPRPGDRQQAIELAARYQIVTPVSGAVVLENASQYQEAGLAQVDPNISPNRVPEPASWRLLLLATLILWCFAARYRA